MYNGFAPLVIEKFRGFPHRARSGVLVTYFPPFRPRAQHLPDSFPPFGFDYRQTFFRREINEANRAEFSILSLHCLLISIPPFAHYESRNVEKERKIISSHRDFSSSKERRRREGNRSAVVSTGGGRGKRMSWWHARSSRVFPKGKGDDTQPRMENE